MAKILLAYGLLLLFRLNTCTVCYSQETLTIKGITTSFYNNATISITASHPFNSVFKYPEVEKTAIVSKNNFHFVINCNSAEFYDLAIKLSNGQELGKLIFLQPGEAFLYLKDTTLQRVEIHKNKSANDYIRFMKSKKIPLHLLQLRNKRNNYLLNNETASVLKFDIVIDSVLKVVLKDFAKLSIDWVRSNPRSLINPFVIKRFISEYYPEDTVRNLYSILPSSSLNSSYGKELKYFMDNLVVGKKLPGFESPDTSGKTVRLSDFQGKYVLVDFWASWCIPCRESHPELVKIFQTYQSKQFTILSISLDEKAGAWKEAIVKDKLSWINISDLKANNDVANRSCISSIPSNFVVNKDGVIIAKNIYGAELRKLLDKRL